MIRSRRRELDRFFDFIFYVRRVNTKTKKVTGSDTTLFAPLSEAI